MSKLKNATFTITSHQERRLNEYCEDTGLLKSEAVRRAIDEYLEREAAKEERKLITPEQWRGVREIARAKGQSAVEIIRLAIDRYRRRFER